ncbi:MAG: SAP domain-containing protein [Muribaculaceae bacterium]|nr:SAP domain-containing protein [Muribaculaceae bacterium]
MKLKPEEIRLLSKINGKTREMLPGYFREYNVNEMLDRLTSGGFLTYADTRYKLSKLTISVLKSILVDNGLSTKGKKDDLVERAISQISSDKLPTLDAYFVTTEKGEEILTINEPLLLHFNTDTMSTTEEVLEMQEKYPGMCGKEVLRILLESKIEKETDPILLYPMMRKLQTIYNWIGGAEKASELDERIAELDVQFWEKYKSDTQKLGEEAARKMDTPRKELDYIYEKALAEMDTDWEAELDRKNKEKAGIK